MAKLGYKLIAALAIAALPIAFAQDALAQQKARNPNMGHFYMARQQWQVTDDAPIVRYRGNGAGAQQQRALPRGPAPLPKAGFQRFSQTLPSYRNTLPQVNNGVPKPVRQAPPNRRIKGKSGKALKWKKSKKSTNAKKKTVKKPVKTKSYSPYKGYNPKVVKKPAHRSGSGASKHHTKTKVRGSVLHWARGNH